MTREPTDQQRAQIRADMESLIQEARRRRWRDAWLWVLSAAVLATIAINLPAGFLK